MKKKDIILICAILAAGLVCLALFSILKEDGAYVIIRVDGEETARYSLEDNGEYALNGGTNILKIENGAARIIEAECPDKLCINFGTIDEGGETITCLPNKLTVTVYGKDGDVDIEVN